MCYFTHLKKYFDNYLSTQFVFFIIYVFIAYKNINQKKESTRFHHNAKVFHGTKKIKT